MKKRLESIVLCLALLLFLAPALGGAARAATNASTLYIAGNADHGYVEDGYDRGNWVYNEGHTALASGESVSVGNGYDNGASATFTYAESGSSTLRLSGYLTYNNAGYENGSNLYGIYYDGSLTVQVYSECQLLAYRSGSYTNIYGIYVTGDLTIELHNGAELSVNLCGNKELTATQESIGIYSGGSLTIRNASDTGSPKVEARGGAVTGMSGNAGSIRSCGAYARNYVQTAGTVKATGGSGVAPESSGTYEIALETYGVCGENGVTVSGGTLTATGGTVPISGLTHGGRSVGILAGSLNTETAAPTGQSALTVSGTAKVTATGGTVNSSASNGNIAWNRSMSCGAAATRIDMRGGTLTATGADVTASGENNSGSDNSGGESFGIRCATYTQSGGVVDATAGKSDIKPQRKYSDSYGVFTYHYDVSGGTLTAKADQAWRESVGLMVHNELNGGQGADIATQSGGTVSGTAAVVAGYVTPKTELCQSTGVWFGDEFQATGGSLSGTASNIGYQRQSTGVLFNGDVSLTNGASVTGTGGDTSKYNIGCTLSSFSNSGGVSGSCGVLFCGTTLTLGENCSLSGTGGSVTGVQGAMYRIDSIGVWLAGADVSVSGGGTLSGTGGTGARGHGGNGSYSDDSYGVYAAGKLTMSGVTVEARGGDVSTETVPSSGEPSQYEKGKTYGVFVTGNASFTDCAVTACGGNVGYTGATEQGSQSFSIGLHSEALTLGGTNTMTLTGGAWSENGRPSYFKSYGMEYSDSMSIERGRIEARGHTRCIFGSVTTSIAYRHSVGYDGSNASDSKGGGSISGMLSQWEYILFDEKLIPMTMGSAPFYSGGPISARPRPVSGVAAPEGEASYLFSGRNETVYAESETAPTDVGEYRVHVSYPGGYYGDDRFTVVPKRLAITGLTAKSREYDGTTDATLTGTPELYGVCEADVDDVTLSGTLAAAFADADAGENKAVTVTGLTLSGERAFNYTLTLPALTASITPRVVTAPTIVLSQDAYVCNGTAREPEIVSVTDGTLAIPAEEYTFSYADNTAVGTAVVTLTDAEGGNFIVSGTAEFAIRAPSVKNGRITAPAGTMLIFAQYAENGRFVSVRCVTIEEDCVDVPFGDLGLAITEDGIYRFLLIDPETFAPLCPAWEERRIR